MRKILILLFLLLLGCSECMGLQQSVPVGTHNISLDFLGEKVSISKNEAVATEEAKIDQTSVTIKNDPGQCYVYYIEYFIKPYMADLGDNLKSIMEGTCVRITLDKKDRYCIAEGYVKKGGQVAYGRTDMLGVMKSVGRYGQEVIVLCEFKNETLNRHVVMTAKART